MSRSFQTSQYAPFAWRSYLQPWKVATFAVGLGLLIAGSFVYVAPDWDIGISILMATLTYLTAPWSARMVVSRRWSQLPLALIFYYLTVDGCYWAYWTLMNPEALYMREANFYASTCLYWLCGFIWLHEGSLRNLLTRPKVCAGVVRTCRPYRY